MENENKVLIISMLSGFGHIRAGEALLDYAKENLKSVKVNHIDICDIDSRFKKYARIYDFLIKRFPLLWDLAYKYLPVSLVKKLVSFNYLTENKVIDYAKKENPDVIIFTNVVVVPMFMATFKKLFPKAILAVIVTDYHAHPYYVFKEIDRYFVGHQEVKEELISFGVKQQRIIVSGIPINPRFYIKQSVASLKKKYKIGNDLPIVLMIASFKLPVSTIIILIKKLLAFSPKINLIVIANGNKKINQMITRIFNRKERLHSILWTNTIEEYIKISDTVITKAGGLTVSECLAINKPMIILKPIPGQEEHNANFVEKNGFGKRVNNIDQVIDVLPRFISEGNRQKEHIVRQTPSEIIFKELRL